MSDIFEDAGFVPSQAKSAAPSVSQSVPTSADVFSDAGFPIKSSPAQKASGQFSDEIPIYAPDSKEYAAQIKAHGVNNKETADTLENRLAHFSQAIDPTKVLPAAGHSWWDATKEAAAAGAQTYQGGLADIGHSMTASGVGKAGLGALQIAMSPASGALKAFVENPVTQMTGNPAIGQDVANTAGILLPTKGAPSVVKAGTEGRAINALVRTVGPENVPAAVARLQSNPRLALMDVSDPVRTVAQGLIDPAQPQAQNIITQAVKDRAATLPAATNSAYTAAMGPAPNVVQMVEGLKQRATAAGKQLIEPALQGAKPVNVSPVLKAIDSEIGSDPVGRATLRALKNGEEPAFPLSDYQRRLFQLRDQMTSGVGDPNAPKFLDATGEQGAHNIQSGLRAEAQNLLTSASGADRNLGGKLMAMRGKIVDAIDDASPRTQLPPRDFLRKDGHYTDEEINSFSPVGQKLAAGALGWRPTDTVGSYKVALSKYRDAKQVEEAFDAGFDTLKNRPGRAGLEDRPESLNEWMSNATPEEIVARRLGTRADIDQKLRGVKNQALAGQNITSIEYNRDKLASLFGKGEADRLTSAMDDTAAESQTNAKILQGSKTAETLAGQRALEVRKVGGGSPLQWMAGPAAEIASQYLAPGTMGLGSAAFLGGKALQLGTQKALQSLDKSRNVAFAKAASATGPARQETIGALLAHPDVVRALQKSRNALTSP
jgi:hypothetical protein